MLGVTKSMFGSQLSARSRTPPPLPIHMLSIVYIHLHIRTQHLNLETDMHNTYSYTALNTKAWLVVPKLMSYDSQCMHLAHDWQPTTEDESTIILLCTVCMA